MAVMLWLRAITTVIGVAVSTIMMTTRTGIPASLACADSGMLCLQGYLFLAHGAASLHATGALLSLLSSNPPFNVLPSPGPLRPGW